MSSTLESVHSFDSIGRKKQDQEEEGILEVVYPVTWEAPIASPPLVTTVTTVSTPVVPSQVTVQVKNASHEAQGNWYT